MKHIILGLALLTGISASAQWRPTVVSNRIDGTSRTVSSGDLVFKQFSTTNPLHVCVGVRDSYICDNSTPYLQAAVEVNGEWLRFDIALSSTGHGSGWAYKETYMFSEFVQACIKGSRMEYKFSDGCNSKYRELSLSGITRAFREAGMYVDPNSYCGDESACNYHRGATGADCWYATNRKNCKGDTLITLGVVMDMQLYDNITPPIKGGTVLEFTLFDSNSSGMYTATAGIRDTAWFEVYVHPFRGFGVDDDSVIGRDKKNGEFFVFSIDQRIVVPDGYKVDYYGEHGASVYKENQ